MKKILRKFEKTLVELKEKKKNIDDFKTELEEYNNNFEKEIEEYNNKMNDLEKIINRKEETKQEEKDFNIKINEKKKEITNIIKRIENNKILNGKGINNYFNWNDFSDFMFMSINGFLIGTVSYISVAHIFKDNFNNPIYVFIFILPIFLLGVSIFIKIFPKLFGPNKNLAFFALILFLLIYFLGFLSLYYGVKKEDTKKEKLIITKLLKIETNKN